MNHLAQARLGGGPTLLPPKTLDVPGLNEAYQAQQKLHEYLSKRGFGSLVGVCLGSCLGGELVCGGLDVVVWNGEEVDWLLLVFMDSEVCV